MANMQSLKLITAEELINMELPAQECILEPWLKTQGLAMIYAPRGVGKTHVSLSIACAVATGRPFLNWSVPKPRKVLFVDGEMPGPVIQERVRDIKKSLQYDEPLDRLKIITPDIQESGIPDLSTREGQDLIDSCIDEETDLIIIDNLTTIARSGNENEAESWLPIQNWSLGHRSQGRTVLFIHHSNKNGNQRGTSRREDVLDTVIALRRPDEYTADQGARFEVHFEKARMIYGDDVIPFEAQLTINDDDTQEWKISPLQESNYEKIIQLHKNGVVNADIAKKLGINRSTVGRNIEKAKNDGRI